MATGGELIIDEKFVQNLQKADAALKKIGHTAEDTATGLNKLLSSLTNVNNALFKETSKNPLKNVSNGISEATDKANRFMSLMSKINNDGADSRRNSAVTKINEELEDSKKRLQEVQRMLNFYAKGEGKKAIGFVDTSSYQNEAKQLMNKIDLLEREKASLQANARLRLELSKRQEARDNAWYAMENNKRKSIQESAKKESDAAKQSSDAYKKAYEQRLRMYEKMFDAIDKKERKMISDAHKRMQIRKPTSSIDIANKEINNVNNMYSKGILSINNMQKALSRLREAQQKLNLNTEKGRDKYKELSNQIVRVQRDLDKATRNGERFNSSNSKLLNITDQLARRFALLFSVSQISNYINRIVTIRKEFELQHKSLQALLQDKDEADKLWAQTIELAVKSPYRIKDLITYTKQLAAYRIETDKLHDTTKRLADVSAGLGIDMSRLILAYGQVRAAEYLRGTELRQFTEAGIPMLAELANYFSNLEGQAVSTAEVFERISKRMVTFKDVDAVIHKITDVGGVFYNMQEKQSQTLYGMWANLQDSVDVMMNEIGKDSEWAIKGTIKILKFFIDNWKILETAITGVVSALSIYGLNLLATNKTIIRYAILTKVATNAQTTQLTMTQLLRVGYQRLSVAINNAIASSIKFVKGNLITIAVMAAIGALVKLGMTISEHSKKIDEITEKYRELNNAVKKISSEFNTALKKDNIEEQKEKLQELITLANKEYQMKIDVKVGEITEEERKELANKIEEKIKQRNAFAERWSRIVAYAQELVIEDDIVDDFKQFDTAASNLSSEFENLNYQVVHYLQGMRKAGTLSKDVADLLDVIEQKRNTSEENYESELQYLKRMSDAYEMLKRINVIRPFAIGKDTPQKLLNTMNDQFIVPLNRKLEEATREFNDNFIKYIHLDDSLSDIEKIQLIDYALDKQALNDFEKELQRELALMHFGLPITPILPNETGFQPWQARVVKAVTELNNKIQQDLERQGKTIDASKLFPIPNVDQTREQYLNIAKDIIAKTNAIFLEGQQIEDNTTIELSKILKPYVKEFKTINNIADENKKSTQSSKDYFTDALKILKDTHKEYKDLTKTLSHADAKQLALDKHTRAFAEAVKNIPSLAKFKLEDFAFDKEDGAIEMLEKLKSLIPATAKNYKSLMVDIEQAIGDIRGEAIIEAKVKADEDLANEIEEMFDGYELSLELDKLGLPKNFMSDLFHIDIFNLDQIRDKIEGEIDKIESGKGEKDNLKKLQDFLKKVDDMEEKQMQERLKKYSKYLLKSQSEAVKIKLEELRQLEEIESLSDVSNAHKKAMRQGVRDEAQQKLGKATWDTFKDSDMYIRLFEDLESQSTRSLNRMREELKKYRNSLKELDDPTALKEISERIESLDEQIAKRNPFKGLSEAYKKFRETRKQLGGEKELELLLDKNRQEESLLQSEVDAKHLKINEAELRLNEALKTGDTFKIALAKSLLRVEENELETLLAQLDAQKEITQEQADALSEQQDAKKEFEDSLSGLGNKIAAYTSALPEIMNDLEAMGVSVDESLKDAAESAAEIGEGVNSIMQGFASNNPLAVIQGITKTGAAISRIFDKSEERRIQRRIKKIEDLSRAYEELQKRIENAYSIGEFRSSYDESYQNIDKQIQAYEDMIAAEEDKKKSDKERIKEWKQAQEDLEQQKKELQDQQLQELGGFGESGVKDAAQQFVDAWMDAFQETGDGLSGLEDKWDEYIKNVIRKQMALKVSDHFIKNITDEVDKALKDDSNLSAEELAKINQMADEALPALSEALQKIANEYGGSALSPSVGELSGLTQGIQGITEQTADQLAGLVNSIRLLVADNYKELVNIANALGTSTQVENPMVGQLKIIASHTNNINSLLESVVTSSTSGRGIRVITQV
jgi:DNA repair exonuclease SbcCD ATPase subunit